MGLIIAYIIIFWREVILFFYEFLTYFITYMHSMELLLKFLNDYTSTFMAL